MNSRDLFRPVIISACVVLLSPILVSCRTTEPAKQNREELVKTEITKSPAGLPFETIQKNQDGQITWWALQFFDYGGKRLLLILKSPDGRIKDVIYHTYNDAGNIKEQWWCALGNDA